MDVAVDGDVLIVGAGSMGRWIADVIDTPVVFTDVDETAAVSAADAIGSRARSVPLETDETFTAVCLAVPMTHVAGAVETHAPNAERAIFDVSGVMAPALEAMETHAPDRERVSLHPLFAPERAPGSIAIVREERGPVTDAICGALEGGGNELVETTAAEHDGAMETVQAATHAAVLSFALAAEPVPEGFETPVYEELRGLAELVTGGTPRVYADIQDTFDGADAVADAAHRLASADPEELEALYREASVRWGPDADTKTNANANANVNANEGESDR